MPKNHHSLTKAERRERKHRPKMKVSGTSVKQLQRIIIRRARKK